jgi:hypothetical protein
MSLRPAMAILVITLAAPAAVTNAHHAFAPVYDAQRMVSVQGTSRSSGSSTATP